MSYQKEQKPERRVKISNPGTLHKPTGYSHVAKVSAGNLLFISGQVALDSKGELVGRDDISLQTRQIFENLGTALESERASLKDIIKLNYYLVDISQMPKVREVRNQYLDNENYPVSTAVEVRGLVRPEFLIEIEAVAVIP
jgi:enamine deaminase RidA (YjgF/YER057c/UK114 family)